MPAPTEDPFTRAGLPLDAAERTRLGEPARLLEALLARVRDGAGQGEPAVIFVPPAAKRP
ncbi:hypothetical protein [Elioraea sp. Yellowstone]|jgi:hypothetical protein|uniref:hypothetical protein n=1 Tax=Elioraea sp. Yellowstone TaxID=2592070 RepID=UPI0013866ACF|nr:hypothetical protein [Elioraea sp. Yellowstone]